MRFIELKQKEVINCKDCRRLGCVADLEFDQHNGNICAIIVPEAGKFFGCFGSSKEYLIPFCDIIRIGPDIILVDVEPANVIGKCSD